MIYLGDAELSAVKLGESDIAAIYVGETKIYPNQTTPEFGNIAYWTGEKIKFISYTKWESSLGTPIGVCVIPSAHTAVWGDGKARYVSVTGVNADGSPSSTNVGMEWGVYGTDTSLTNYTRVPTWDNTIGGTVGSNISGNLSSNSGFTGTTNVIDTCTNYYSSATTYMIPSPYSGNGEFYADYKRTIEGNNALSDFNGKANTATLVGLGTAYSAANACYKYKTSGTSAGDWYLPACGELAYILPRRKEIDTALVKCGGVKLGSSWHWSSTEYDAIYAYGVNADRGGVSIGTKNYSSNNVRPFVALS